MPFECISSDDQAVMIPDLYALRRFKPTPSIEPRFFVVFTEDRSAGFHVIILTQKRDEILP